MGECSVFCFLFFFLFEVRIFRKMRATTPLPLIDADGFSSSEIRCQKKEEEIIMRESSDVGLTANASQRQPTPYENPIYRSTRNHFRKLLGMNFSMPSAFGKSFVFSYYIFKTLAIVHDASARQRAQVLARWREGKKKKIFQFFFFGVPGMSLRTADSK